MSTELQNETQSKLEPVLKPYFPKATEILFHTGNTLKLFKLLKKSNSSINDEILEYISMILQSMNTELNKQQYQEVGYIKLNPVLNDIQSETIDQTIPDDHIDDEKLLREDLKFSVKIFLRSLEPEILRHTINQVFNELNEDYLESVMISLPNYGSHLKIDDLIPLWNIIEEFIDQKKILSAGVCDFMLPLLSNLYDTVKHKPHADQINLRVCCAIPEELDKYTKENNIQLLTHNDPIDVLNESDFQQSIREHCHEYDAINWKPCSVVRYSSVIANRGIIKSKGFFIYAKRELRIS